MTTDKISKVTLSFFKGSGLTQEHAKKMHVRDVGSPEMKRLFSGMRFSSNVPPAHEYPYFDLFGKLIGFIRYRLHDVDEPKYLQIAGQKSHFYFPPFLDWKNIAENPSIPIYITEGERKAAKACVMGFPCVGLGGVWNWLRKDGKRGEEATSQPIKDFQLIEWKGRKVIITFDSDSQFNTNIQNASRRLRDTLVAFGADPYRKDLPHKAGNTKVGLDDFLKSAGGKKAFENLPSIPLLLNKTMTGKELVAKKFEPTKWIIKGLIPCGLTLLAGPPKIGKSWLVLLFILSASTGKKALGHYEAESMKCLYLALEDSPRRLKERIQKLSSAGYPVNDLSNFAYEWERVDNEGLAALERKLDEDKSIKAVFIDTFAKMRRTPSGRENLYHQDYDAVTLLKNIADKRGIGIVVVHHTKKGSSDDFLESVSGSMGVTGAADTVIVLRRSRSDDEGILQITGRDVGEQAIALAFDNGLWTYKGLASEVQATETQAEILEVMKAEGRPLRQKELADIIGRKNQGFTKTLLRLVEKKLIVRKGYLYSLADTLPQKHHKLTHEDGAAGND